MSVINRVPRGLQSFLGSQNQGDNPSELARSVVGVIDMRPFYEADALQAGISNTVNRATDGTITLQVVPVGEVWFLKTVGVLFTTDMTDLQESMSFSCNLINFPGASQPTQQLPIAFLGRHQSRAASNGSFAFNFPEPLVVPGGTTIAFNLFGTEFTGAHSVTSRTSVRYLKENA